MALYSYLCSECGEKSTLRRTMEKRNDALRCHLCGGEAKRQIADGLQIIGELTIHQPANKYALGFDETTRKETLKKHEAMYARNHANGE